MPPISCLAELPNGTTLEGVVKDISDGGARVSTSTTGLSEGDEIQLVFIVQPDQKVARRCEVRYVDHERNSFGLQFKTSAEPIQQDDCGAAKTCCEHTQDTPFCAYCGSRLAQP